MPNETIIRRAVARLSLMKFFPADPDFRGAMAELLNQLCSSDEQADKLSQHFQRVYPEWAGAHELRACACSMFKPADGINADSVIYPEGIPTAAELKTPEVLAIPPAARRLDLPLPEQVTAFKQIEAAHSAPYIPDPELAELVKQMAKPLPPLPPRTIEEIRAELYNKKRG